MTPWHALCTVSIDTRPMNLWREILWLLFERKEPANFVILFERKEPANFVITVRKKRTCKFCDYCSKEKNLQILWLLFERKETANFVITVRKKRTCKFCDYCSKEKNLQILWLLFERKEPANFSHPRCSKWLTFAREILDYRFLKHLTIFIRTETFKQCYPDFQWQNL